MIGPRGVTFFDSALWADGGVPYSGPLHPSKMTNFFPQGRSQLSFRSESGKRSRRTGQRGRQARVWQHTGGFRGSKRKADLVIFFEDGFEHSTDLRFHTPPCSSKHRPTANRSRRQSLDSIDGSGNANDANGPTFGALAPRPRTAISARNFPIFSPHRPISNSSTESANSGPGPFADHGLAHNSGQWWQHLLSRFSWWILRSPLST